MTTTLETIDNWQQYLDQAPSDSAHNSSLFFQQAQYNNACFYLHELQLVHVQGADAFNFLQGQLSCDLHTITLNQSGIGTHNNLKGRMLSSFRIVKTNEHSYFLVLHASIIDDAIAQLKKYAVFSNVNISHQRSYIVLAAHLEAAQAKQMQLDTMERHQTNKHDEHFILQVDTQGQRFLMLTPITQARQLWEQLRQYGITQHPMHIWQAADIQQGLAWIERATQDKFIAQTYNYHNIGGISFTKGCYIGQEIIIRTQHRGTLKKGLFSIVIKNIDAQQLIIGNELLTNNKSIGQIVAQAPLSEQASIILAVINKDFDSHTNVLSIQQTTLDIIQSQAVEPTSK